MTHRDVAALPRRVEDWHIFLFDRNILTRNSSNGQIDPNITQLAFERSRADAEGP